MRMNKNREFEQIAARSVAKDFKGRQTYHQKEKTPKTENSPKITRKRIAQISERCEYARYARFFIGRAVELVSSNSMGSTGWYKFVFDKDRQELNKAAGWSDRKKEYLLENPKFK